MRFFSTAHPEITSLVIALNRPWFEDRQLRMLRHLRTLIPSKRPAKVAWGLKDTVLNRITHRLGPMSGERGSMLLVQLRFVSSYWQQMKKQSEACDPLNQRTDGRTVRAKDQIPFPIPRNSAIRRFSTTFANHDSRRNKGLAAARDPGARNPEGPSSAKARGQLPLEGSTSPDVERLTDCLMAVPHLRVPRKVELQPSRYLFWALSYCPPPRLIRAMTPLPRERAAPHRDPAPSLQLGHGLQWRICSSSCSSRLHPSWKLEPPAKPGRFSRGSACDFSDRQSFRRLCLLPVAPSKGGEDANQG